ncbi:MAG: MerR family transcriptional regulator [Candidatus Eremiobacteraeota bacterium]|nr:MerR family transcriptional regulator [Candidatus Eremiobacteraeota bacterium]
MAERYQIGAVAKMTGLSLDTIRGWERRYGLVKPERDGSGTRLYALSDILRLQLAKEATRLGHSIRRVAALKDDAIRQLVAPPSAADDHHGSAVVAACIAALQRYDIARVESLLISAATLMTPENFVLDVLSALMRSIGTLWESGGLSVAQEHIASTIVRDIIGSLTRLRPPAAEQTMLFATPAGELHEFGILLAATLAGMRGIGVHVLGSNVPVTDLLGAARYLRPTTVVIGIAHAGLAEDFDDYVTRLDRKLQPGLKLWVGGSATLPMGAWSDRVQFIPTLEDFAHRMPRFAMPHYAIHLTKKSSSP